MLPSNRGPKYRSLIAKASLFLGSCVGARTSSSNILHTEAVDLDPVPITTIRQSISVDGCAVPLPSLFQPMEMIPVEILVEILAYSLPPVDHHQAWWRERLALVCRHWNALVEGTPILWSKIFWRDTLPKIEQSLTKSGTHPIDVYGYPPNTPLFTFEINKYRRFLELVSCHVGRWRHVTLGLLGDVSLGPTGSPTPLLEYLEVYNKEPDANKAVTTFPIAWTPRLREVRIHCLERIQLDMPFPPTLSKLIVTRVDYQASYFSKLLTILIECPGLTALGLSSDFDYVEDEAWATFPVVELPTLQKLTLRTCGTQSTQVILQRLQFPYDCLVHLSIRLVERDPSTNLTSTVAHHLDGLLNRGINQITVSIERYRSVLIAQGPRWKMELEVVSLCLAKHIVLLLNPEGTTSAEGSLHNRVPVTLRLSQYIRDRGLLLDLPELLDLRSITSLQVRTDEDAHVAILSQLARPSIKEGAMPTWPLPGLRKLYVKGPMVNIDPVIKFVENRRGEGDRLGTPAPLERIEFEGYQVEGRYFSPWGPPEKAPRDSLFELLDILDGGAQVIWNGERVRRK